MQTGEDAVNGVNGVEADQEMVNAEEPIAPTAGITTERQPNQVRITTPYLTKYERARILGTRALQIRSLLIPSSYILVLSAFEQHECSCACSSGWGD